MLIAPLCLVVLMQHPSNTLTLERGGTGDSQFRYWAVEDTFLDSLRPDENFGRDALLSAGPGKTVLIRFGDLERMTEGRGRIKKARLCMHIEIGNKPKLRGAQILLAPWAEGPMRRTPGIFGETKLDIELWPSATWRHRFSGKKGVFWQTAGAQGYGDAKTIPGVTVREESGDAIIEGLEGALNDMRQKWYSNHGFALHFQDPIDFASSDAPSNRPRLELEFEPFKESKGANLSVSHIVDRESKTKWTGTISNIGLEPSPGFTARWFLDEKMLSEVEISSILRPNESTEVKIDLASAKSEQWSRLRLEVIPKSADSDATNNAVEIFLSADPVPVSTQDSPSYWDKMQRIFRFWNETALPQSRFSFAPTGSARRFRLVPSESGAKLESLALRKAIYELSRQIGMPDLGVAGLTRPKDASKAVTITGEPILQGSSDLYPGIMKGGDTRDELHLPKALPLSYEPFSDQVLELVTLSPTDLYAATDIAFLNSSERGFAPLPNTILLKVVDGAGLPLKNCPIELFQRTSSGSFEKVGEAKTGLQGNMIVPVPEGKPSPFGELLPDASNAALLLKTSLNGRTAYGWLKAWQAADTLARTGQGLALMVAQLFVQNAILNEEMNLAESKFVSDSSGAKEADLASLVDGSISTTYRVAKGDEHWIEIDLGRDRPVGEIQLLIRGESIWSNFSIQCRGTAQTPDEGYTWAKVTNGRWWLENRAYSSPEGELTIVPLIGPATRMRYVRLQMSNIQEVNLAEIRVIPIKVMPNE